MKPLETITPLKDAVMKYIYRALLTKNWNRTQTAKALGISIRTLRNYIPRLNKAGYGVTVLSRGRRKNETKECQGEG